MKTCKTLFYLARFYLGNTWVVVSGIIIWLQQVTYRNVLDQNHINVAPSAFDSVVKTFRTQVNTICVFCVSNKHWDTSDYC